MLPPERRLHHVLALIEARRYFTLHAGRQTGKTTSAMWLEDHLGGSGRWRALWLDLETAREKPEVTRAMTAILKVLDDALAARHPQQPRPSPASLRGRRMRCAARATRTRAYQARVSRFVSRPPRTPRGLRGAA